MQQRRRHLRCAGESVARIVRRCLLDHDAQRRPASHVRRVGDDAPEREDVGGGPDLPAPGLLGRHVPALSRRSRALVRDVFAARGPGDAEVAEVHRA